MKSTSEAGFPNTADNIESGERYDAKNALAAWRMCKPEEFFGEVDVLLAEARAMPSHSWGNLDSSEGRRQAVDQVEQPSLSALLKGCAASGATFSLPERIDAALKEARQLRTILESQTTAPDSLEDWTE